MTSVPEGWAQQAQYDFDTAKAMLESGRLLYVLFCCQQAIEKVLKAPIAKRTQQFPPRAHNLMRLAEVAAVEVSEECADFLRELSAYYIQSRYPEEMDEAAGKITREMAGEILVKTEEAFQWLSSML